MVVALALTAVPCLAGEAPKQTKAERIAALQKQVADDEYVKKNVDAGLATAAKDGKQPSTSDVINQRILAKRIESARTEIAWLGGELTTKGCEVKVEAAQAAVDKADEKAKPDARKVLEKAKAELELVKGFEARGEF